MSAFAGKAKILNSLLRGKNTNQAREMFDVPEYADIEVVDVSKPTLGLKVTMPHRKSSLDTVMRELIVVAKHRGFNVASANIQLDVSGNMDDYGMILITP